MFRKKHYSTDIVPTLHQFKFKYFGHDVVILHEHEIRKEKGEFRFFVNRAHKNAFLCELTEIIDRSHFDLISCVVDKVMLGSRETKACHPYHLALGYCLETLFDFLRLNKQETAKTHVIVECRGKKEDKALGNEFRRVCECANRFDTPLPFDLVFADKKTNAPGLQFADLVARPIGMSVVRAGQDNRAFDLIKGKLFPACGSAMLIEYERHEYL